MMNKTIIDRCSTGITGLDDILEGGLPREQCYVIKGDPGVGKTTLALQFLLAGTRGAEAGLYITFSETQKELMAVANSHGWKLEGVTVIDFSLLKSQLKLEQSFSQSPVDRPDVMRGVLAKTSEYKPLRVVIDSVSELRLLCGDALRFRHQVLYLKDFFASEGATTLLLDDGQVTTVEQLLDGVAHGVLALEKNVSDFGAEHRRLKVLKLRGSAFKAGYHNYMVEHGGLKVFPRLIAADFHRKFDRKSLKSGIPELDALLGGGIDFGTSTLLSGPSGVGKSTFALQYAYAAAKQGLKTSFYSFEESIRTTVHRAASIGFDIAPYISSGKIIIRQIDPGELSPGQFSHGIKESVSENNVSVVVVDSLNGYLNAMPDERFLTIQLHELLMYLAQQGVATLLTMAQYGIVHVQEGPVDISYLADTVVVFRYFEAFGRVKKAISVIKKRSGSHEDTIREFQIAQNGIQVGEPLVHFQGVLNGTPSFFGQKNEVMASSEKKTPGRKRKKKPAKKANQ